MKRKYSRYSKLEEKRNIKRAFLYIFSTVLLLFLFVSFGIPSIAKFASFLSDIKTSDKPIERKDSSPPIRPRLDHLDDSTNKPNIDITGTAEPGSTVVLFLNGEEKEVLVNKEGNFLYTFSLKKGVNTISALTKDTSGNKSPETNVIRVEYDDIPPDLEITKPDTFDFFGPRQRQVVIEGTTEEEASVVINERFVVVDSTGSFSFVTTLEEGENEFVIKAEDKAGNVTEKVIILTFQP